MLSIDSGRAGATVLVTANLHGDEATGMAAVHQLYRWLDRHLLRGKVVLYPSLNPAGLFAGVREAEGADLNRAFPGDQADTPVAALARQLWTELTGQQPDLLIDLHSDSARAIPYAIVDRAVSLAAERAAMEVMLRAAAVASGLTVLAEYPDAAYLRFELQRSLAGAMVNHAAIPAITLECGPRRVVDPDAVTTMVHAVAGVLEHRGLVSVRSGSHATYRGGPWRRAATPRVPRSGWFVPAVVAGTELVAGERLGRISSLSGDHTHDLLADQRCLLVSWVDATWIQSGGVVGTLGVVDA